MRSIPLPAGGQAGPLAPKRLLSLAGDDRIVEQIRRGNDAAFEVAYERHSPGILSFCRHMLGSRDEAEDAVQQTFASAYPSLIHGTRPIKLKPWLYTIARNRCLSMLRARRDGASDELEVATAGLHEQVQRRADLRQLLHDLEELPEDQRAALLLSEAGDLSHAEVAEVIGCEVPRVKALVFRARSGLIERRKARETPCQEIREQLATLRGGSLRRSELRHHLRSCPGCRAFREEVRRQRQMLAIVLPVVPSLGLKSSVLAAVGLGGGHAGGSAAGGLGAAGAAASAPLGTATLAKVAIVAVAAGGGAAAGRVALPEGSPEKPSAAPAVRDARSPARHGPGAGATPFAPAKPRSATAPPTRDEVGDSRGTRGVRRRVRAHGPAGAPGQLEGPGSRGLGAERRSPKALGVPRGRGAPAVPPLVTPVRRGRREDRPVRRDPNARALPDDGSSAPKRTPMRRGSYEP